MLTKKQNQLLKFLISKIKSSGISPSYDEICIHLSLKSKSGIHRIVHALEERDFIVKHKNKARSLFPKRYPNGELFIKNNVIPGSEIPLKKNYIEDDQELVKIPMIGKIAAGNPIEAIENFEDYIELPISLATKGQFYCLKVEGESMLNAGILENDLVIINSKKNPINGDIVVALIDDEEVTLKRFRKKGDTIALEPANDKFKTHIYGPDRVKIQGVLSSLIRSY